MKKINYSVVSGLMLVTLFTQCDPKPVNKTPAPTAEKPVVSSEPSATGALNTLSAKEKAEGWKLLFDGTGTDGWHTYGSRTIGTKWQVSDGALFLNNDKSETPKTGGDIVTDEEYTDFELELDWKIDKGGNSGICIYIHEDKDKYRYMWNTGPEIQVLDNDGHADGKIHKHRAGDLYDLIASSSEPTKGPLEWNHVKIRANKGKLDLYLNGMNVVTTTMWDDNWRSLIAGSKFKNMTDFGTYKTGRIGLQDHGNNVWFRNIKIRRL